MSNKLTSASLCLSNIFRVKYGGDSEGKNNKRDFHVATLGFGTRLRQFRSTQAAESHLMFVCVPKYKNQIAKFRYLWIVVNWTGKNR